MRIYSLTQSDGQTAFMRIYNDDVSVASQIAKYLGHRDVTVQSVREITEADVPPEARPGNRAFRSAVVDTGTNIAVDMSKARVIHMDTIREARADEFVRIDQEIQKLEDTGGDASALRVQRQTLRDIPQTFDLTRATTPSELEALWPADLQPRRSRQS